MDSALLQGRNFFTKLTKQFLRSSTGKGEILKIFLKDRIPMVAQQLKVPNGRNSFMVSSVGFNGGSESEILTNDCQ